MSVTTDSVTLQWKPPQTTNGVITHYSVQYEGTVINNFSDNTSDTITRNIGGLSPNTEYSLQLRAHTKAGEGLPTSITVKTRKLFLTNKQFLKITYIAICKCLYSSTYIAHYTARSVQ